MTVFRLSLLTIIDFGENFLVIKIHAKYNVGCWRCFKK